MQSVPDIVSCHFMKSLNKFSIDLLPFDFKKNRETSRGLQDLKVDFHVSVDFLTILVDFSKFVPYYFYYKSVVNSRLACSIELNLLAGVRHDGNE